MFLLDILGASKQDLVIFVCRASCESFVSKVGLVLCANTIYTVCTTCVVCITGLESLMEII